MPEITVQRASDISSDESLADLMIHRDQIPPREPVETDGGRQQPQERDGPAEGLGEVGHRRALRRDVVMLQTLDTRLRTRGTQVVGRTRGIQIVQARGESRTDRGKGREKALLSAGLTNAPDR